MPHLTAVWKKLTKWKRWLQGILSPYLKELSIWWRAFPTSSISTPLVAAYKSYGFSFSCIAVAVWLHQKGGSLLEQCCLSPLQLYVDVFELLPSAIWGCCIWYGSFTFITYSFSHWTNCLETQVKNWHNALNMITPRMKWNCMAGTEEVKVSMQKQGNQK